MPAVRWYVQHCPLGDQCSTASWKRVNYCTSFLSEEDCRKKLVHRLTYSANHADYIRDGPDTAENIAAAVEVWNDEVEARRRRLPSTFGLKRCCCQRS